jgi:hypothetical protein
VLLVALALLAGCSAMRLAYNQAPSLAYWWLNGYADFNDEQKPRVRHAVAEWFKWHRATQLAGYAVLLERAQVEVEAPVTAAQLCGWHAEVLQRVAMAADHAVPALADVALSFTPQQLEHMEHKYAKVNDKFSEEFVDVSVARRVKASLKRTVERAETLYGSLDDEQQGLLAKGIAASPYSAEAVLAERKARQQETLQFLRRVTLEPLPAEQVQAGLRSLVEHVQRSPRPAYHLLQQRVAQHNCALAAQLHNTTTPEQRRTAARKLKDWEEDFRTLAAQAVQ